ncbi:MAG: aminopeptidase P family protein [Thermoplasmata archaeon]|nr:aminopeptidase P family protein [Thermoplasmata archaeon]
MEPRVKRIFAGVKEPLDAVVLINGTEPQIDKTFFYATGIQGGIFEGCVAVLRPDGGSTVLSSQLEADIARAQGIPVEVFTGKPEKAEALDRLLEGMDAIGINGNEVTYTGYRQIVEANPKAEIHDVSDAVVKARQVKDATEVGLLREACRIAVEALEELLPSLEVGRTESEVAAELNYLMQTKGASGPAFSPIVASGPNAALPHHATGDRTLRDGDFLLIDFGARYRGYASDVTRTMVLGRAQKKQRRMYEVVLEAQQAAMDAMEPGADGKAIYELARDVIDATEFKGRFIHGLGHTIGLAVHDGAGMGSLPGTTLEEGMAMTVEPGVYLVDYGGVRIEDDVLITADGVDLLTPATHEFLEL